QKDSYPVPPIFKMISVAGDIEEYAMYEIFNMGIGMILGVKEADVEKTMEAIKASGEEGYIVGHIENGDKGVTLC
ncbi:MAG: AIR synthase-related protein, partial [Lachnospiraceae bacterium]